MHRGLPMCKRIFELLEEASEMENWAEVSVDLGKLFEWGVGRVSGDPSLKLCGWFAGQVKSFHVGSLAPI